MLCSSCQTTEATVFLVDVFDGKPTRRELCEKCARQYFDVPEDSESPWTHRPSFDELVELLARSNAKFKSEAYHFVRAGVQYSCTTRKPPDQTSEPFHVSAPELLQDLAYLAREQFGFQARDTLASWGIRCCDDFGTVLYDLLEAGLVGSSDRDRRTDFYPGYDFSAEFPTS